MKLTIDNLEKTYRLCMSMGSIREKSVDIELIKSLKIVAEKGVEFINSKSRDIPKDSTDWTFVFRDYYESFASNTRNLNLTGNSWKQSG